MVKADPEKPQHELIERVLRKIAPAIEVALARHVGVVHHPFVFRAVFKAA